MIANCLVAVLLGYDKRRDQTNDVRSDGGDQQMAVKAAMFDFYAADGIIKLYADQQSLMSDFFDMRQFC